MDSNSRGLKRAKTVRTEYLKYVDDVQRWLQEAEVKVQDRGSEPKKIKEHIQTIEDEISAINDKLNKAIKHGKEIIEKTKDEEEKEMIPKTIESLVGKMSQVKLWLDEKRNQIGDTLDAWQKFLSVYDLVMAWCQSKTNYLEEPITLSSLEVVKQKAHEFSAAVKSSKQQSKHLAEMSKELDIIALSTDVGQLPEKLEEANNAKNDVEGKLSEKNALLHETCEEWEQFERKLKDVKSFIEKSQNAIESAANKKRTLREQHDLREKMLADITIQRNKITLSTEKLQIHFRAGFGGSENIEHLSKDSLSQLDKLFKIVEEQAHNLEESLSQLDKYQQEIQHLRQKVITAEQKLRLTQSPTYLPHDRPKAVQEQNTIKSHLQALSDESIPLELAMKPFVAFNEGQTAINELTSTQTMISSLITDDDDQSQTKAIKELKTYIEQYEQSLVELGINEDKYETYDLSTKIIKLKEIITRYEMYEEIELFQILIIRLRTVVEKLENLVMNKNKMAIQKKLKDTDDIICYYEDWLLTIKNDGPKYVDNIEEKIIELKNELHQLETYEDNVEYETRILKLQCIIEKLDTIKDNFTNQKDTKYNVESTVISTELSCMNSPKNLHNTSVESMMIPKLNYSLNHPKIETQSHEKYYVTAPSVIKNMERDNEINTINMLKDSEVLRSPKLVRKINQALSDDHNFDKTEINVDNKKVLGSLEQTELDTSNRFETEKPLEKTKSVDVNTQSQSDKVDSPEKKEDKKSKGFLRFKMPNVFMKKSKQGEIDNESLLTNQLAEQNVDIESDNVKLLMYKRMSSVSSDTNILQQNENQLNDEKNKIDGKEKDLSYTKGDNSTALTSINDKVARIIEQNKLKYSNDKTIQQVQILSKNQPDMQTSDFPFTNNTQIIKSDPTIIINSRRTVKRIMVIDGKEIEVEDIIDEPASGESVKSIIRKITKDGKEELENINDPEEIECVLRLSRTNDNVQNTCVTITKTHKTILRSIIVDGKVTVVEEEFDEKENEEISNEGVEKNMNDAVNDEHIEDGFEIIPALGFEENIQPMSFNSYMNLNKTQDVDCQPVEQEPVENMDLNKSSKEIENSPSFLSKLMRKGLKISTPKNAKKSRDNSNIENAEIDDKIKSDLNLFIEKEREDNTLRNSLQLKMPSYDLEKNVSDIDTQTINYGPPISECFDILNLIDKTEKEKENDSTGKLNTAKKEIETESDKIFGMVQNKNGKESLHIKQLDHTKKETLLMPSKIKDDHYTEIEKPQRRSTINDGNKKLNEDKIITKTLKHKILNDQKGKTSVTETHVPTTDSKKTIDKKENSEQLKNINDIPNKERNTEMEETTIENISTVKKLKKKRIIRKIIISNGKETVVDEETEEIEDSPNVTLQFEDEFEKNVDMLATQNVDSNSFLSKLRRGLKMSTSKNNKKMKNKSNDEVTEKDETMKSLLNDFIEKERESTVVQVLPESDDNTGVDVPGYEASSKTPIEVDKPKDDKLDVTKILKPFSSEIQIDQTGTFNTWKSRRVVRRIIIIDGKEIEVEETIDEPEPGAPVKSILRRTIRNGEEVVENIIDPEEIENVLKLSVLNDNVKNTSESVTTTRTRRIIRRTIIVDGKESVVEEEIDEPGTDEITDRVILKSFNDGLEEVGQLENLDKVQRLFSVQTSDSGVITDPNVITKTITRRVIRRIVVVDGEEKVVDEVVELPETDVLGSNIDSVEIAEPLDNSNDFLKFERVHPDFLHKNEHKSTKPNILESVEKNILKSDSKKMVLKKVISANDRIQFVMDMVEDQSPRVKPIKLNDLSVSSNRLNTIKNNILRSDNKNKYIMYSIFFEEICELLDVITYHFSKHKKVSDADVEFCLEEPINSKQILNQIESVVKEVSNIKEKHTSTNDEFEKIKSMMETLQNKTKLVKRQIDTFEDDIDLVNWQNHILAIENVHKKIEQYKSEFEQLKKGKSSFQEKLQKLEILIDNNQLSIEELFDIISIYKVKYNSKNKLPDDTYKSLRAAIKLDKEIGNTTKFFIDEIEKDNFTNLNSKQLELVCGPSKNSNENSIKYYNIKHILEDLDKYHHVTTKLINLKTLSESQKPDKNAIKHLDTELNSTQSNTKKLLFIQNEWTRLEDILTAEQKWLDEIGVSILDLTKITSINYVQTLSTTQNTITDVAIHYDKLIYLKDIIEKLQNQIDVKPLLYVCEQHTNDTFKLKNNLRAKEIRLITFKKQFDKYSKLKNNIELSLLSITSKLEDITPNQEIVDNNMIRYELEIVEESIRTCSNSLNESLDILPISDGQGEIETMASLATECKALKDKLHKTRSTVDNCDVSKMLKHLETSLEKPKDTLLDHIKTLKGVSYEIIAIGSLENNDQQFNNFQSQCNSQLKDYTDLNRKTETLRNTLFELTNDINNADYTLSELENESHKDRHTSETAICKTYHQVSDNIKNMQQTLSSTSQQLKQLKDGLKHFKKDRKLLESEVNEVEKRYKQLKTKHQSVLKTFENKCNYWTMVDELLLKIRIKNNYINNLTIIPLDSDTLAGKHLEAILKHLKDVRSSYEKENKAILADIESLRRKGDKEQIDEIIDGDQTQWNDTGAAVKQLVERYEKASKTLHSYQQLRESTNDCLNSKLLSIETTEDVSDKTKSIDKQQENLVELRNMISDVAETIGLNPNDVPLNEIEELSLKLDKVQKVLAALGDVADKKNKMSDDIEDAKRHLHDIEKNSSKSIKNNDENLKELRTKLLDLNKSKKEMDESIDIDHFEIPLNERRTYSIIEVFQLWQQIFKETFNQYRRVSCTLLENENNVAVFELWHDYLMYVQEFLKSPVPGDYHSLTSHERLCQVHQEVLISQMDTIPNCMNKPDIISEPAALERFTSLMDLHNETMTELENTHQEVWTKLGHWKEYRTNVKKVYEWLWKVEKVHSNLNLKFINTRRLPQLKSQITNLLHNLSVERSQIDDLEKRQNTIFAFCDKPTETGYRKELIAISQRVNEIQASLEVWNGYLENVEKLTTSFDVQSTEIDQILQDVQIKLDTLKHGFGSNEDIVPSDKLNIESNKIQELNNSLKQLDPQLSSTTDIRDKLKDSLDPIEIRSFGQKLRFLMYHQKDLQYQLFLYSCQIDNLLHKPQEFIHRYTRFRNWAVDTETQLKNLTKSLKDPQFAIDVLKPEFESQINSKQKEFNWLNGAGSQLIKAESQLNPQLAKTTESNLKEINENWSNLNGSLYKYTVELPTTILNTNKLFDKINIFKIWISDFESKINSPIVFNDRSEYNLKEELKSLDALSSMYKEKQGEYNELMANCNEQLKSDKNTNDSDATQDLQCPSKTLPINWKNLENKISDKRVRVLNAWEELQTILGLVDVETKWLSRLNIAIEEHNKKKFVEHKSLSGLISNFEQEQQTAKDKFSKLELAVSISRSTYTAKFVDEEIEIISKTRKSLLEQIDRILIVLKKSLTLWKDFINAHGRAVVTLTQVDTKLIQLELLEKGDNADEGSARVMEKDLGNLQILEMELKKYGGLLEKADALGLQLMTNSTPGDIKNIQEMIDEYQLLWKDINNRIEKLKVTCVQETSCRKKRSVNEEVQVETLKFGKDSQVQVDTLPTELLRKDSFQYELQTAMANANTNLNELELAIQKSDKNLSKNIATCQMSMDLIKHLSIILKTQCGVSESDITIIRSEELLTKYEELLVKFRSQQQVGQPKTSNSAMCPLCSEQNWSQFENDMWRLEHWIQSTEAKLSVQPMVPPSKIEQLEDVIQEHRELLLYLDSHRNIVQSLNVIGHHLAEHSNDVERAAQIKNRLSATNSRWDRVCFACTEWQTKLQTALMENEEFYGVIDELVDWLDETERAIKTTEPVDLAEDTVIIVDKFNKFKNMHTELERCEPRVVSLLEAADWLRQANEKTGAMTRSASTSDQTVVDSHARLSHLRARLTVLINMTASYATKLGTTLGYDMTSDSVCIRLHQVDDTSTAMNRSNEEEPNTNVGGDETVLRRGYRFFGRVMRASLPFQVLMLLVLGAASLVPIVDEEFSCMESNSIAWSLYPLLRYPGGPPPV